MCRFFLFILSTLLIKSSIMKNTFGFVLICFLGSLALAQGNLVNPNNIDLSFKK